MVMNGASFNTSRNSEGSAYIVNHSHSVAYFKPESREANPGLEPDAAYEIAPGESLYAPVDAIVTAATKPGNIFRIPTGSRVVINENGVPVPANIIARGGLLLPAYGDVLPPEPNFAKLANSKHIIYRMPDISVRRF